MDSDTSKKILESVKSAYSNIADDFDCTRKALWPGLENFLPYVKNGDQVLDAGCGNGRLYQLFQGKNIQYIGCDNNMELIARAKKNYPSAEFAIGDLLHLPFSDNAFDVVFCIAAFHHIPGRELRRTSLLEMKRVLKPGGYMCMTNWDRYNKKYFFYILKYGILKIFGLSKMDFKDVLVPWKKTISRYYHCFTLHELEKEFQGAGFSIQKKYKQKMAGQKNLVIIGKKI
jgi:tRNA (uracil-5-)-methyltransferase TRM9